MRTIKIKDMVAYLSWTASLALILLMLFSCNKQDCKLAEQRLVEAEDRLTQATYELYNNPSEVTADDWEQAEFNYNERKKDKERYCN